MIKEITRHGQDYMEFHCDLCNHSVSIDTFDVLTAEDNLHCPVCGATSEHLKFMEFNAELEMRVKHQEEACKICIDSMISRLKKEK